MSAHSKKKLLIVQTKAPYGSSAIQEALDVVLAAGTFDQDVSLLISEDACYQLLSAQSPELIDQKNTAKMLNALSIYGIDKVYLDAEQAGIRNIQTNTAAFKLQSLTQTEIQRLYQTADTIIRF